MQQKNPAENFFGDMQSALKKMTEAAPSSFPFDMQTMMEAQRKNIQAITEANQRTFQGWQALAQRQTEMFTQFVQDNSTLARETFSDATPETAIAKQTELLKSSYEKTVENTQELAEMVRKCTAEAAEVISQRVVANLGEIKASAKK